jgi:hypothetical protein
LTKNLFFWLLLSRNLDKNVFIKKKPSISQGLPVRTKMPLRAALITMFLFSVVTGTIFVKLATANFIQFGWGVLSPESKTYAVKTIPLIIRFTVYSYYEKWYGIRKTIVEIFYSIDERANVTVPITFSTGKGDEIYTAETVLSGLSDGFHTVAAYAKDQNGKVYAREITFEVDTTLPEISFLSVDEKTYDECGIQVNFTVNEPVSQITHSLDGQKNVTIAGNTTLTNLTYGEHNFTVYAWDIAGNVGSSETIIFTIAEPEPELSQTILVIAPVASVAVVGAGLLVYFKKRKKS